MLLFRVLSPTGGRRRAPSSIADEFLFIGGHLPPAALPDSSPVLWSENLRQVHAGIVMEQTAERSDGSSGCGTRWRTFTLPHPSKTRLCHPPHLSAKAGASYLLRLTALCVRECARQHSAGRATAAWQ
ncbi:hypothetical protein E2C01_088546 [Portunus trituberculatus]|uniref:Uncharacterized protein n=1 Tax=Portunus trituberculatus TaxID=210409 RepID=A0A5B7J6H6_PORTR|nr:hypothetical protein [Portunus trituberculatus]